MVRTCGASIHPIPTSPEEGYHYADRAKIEAQINEHTRAIMVTNPGNPTGVVLTPDEMRMMVDIAKEHDLFIIGDEAYREFVYAGEPLQSIGEFARRCRERHRHRHRLQALLRLRRPHRLHDLPQQGADGPGHEVLPSAVCPCPPSIRWPPPRCTAWAPSTSPPSARSISAAATRSSASSSEIPGVVCECPKGAFYLMAALPVDDADTFQQWLLEEFDDNGDTVMFAPGEPFYATPGKGRNEIRIAYVLKQADLERAMDLLAKGIAAYNEKNK